MSQKNLMIIMFTISVNTLFASTDAEYDRYIAYEKDPIWKQIAICDKAVLNHPRTSNVDDCKKVITMKKRAGKKFDRKSFGISYLNIGVIYKSQGEIINAYKYYMKSANEGNTLAQKYLNKLCRQSPWACK